MWFLKFQIRRTSSIDVQRKKDQWSEHFVDFILQIFNYNFFDFALFKLLWSY